MKLVIVDRAGKEPLRETTDVKEIAERTQIIADFLGRPVKDVRKDLVSGLTLQTFGYSYTLQVTYKTPPG